MHRHADDDLQYRGRGLAAGHGVHDVRITTTAYVHVHVSGTDLEVHVQSQIIVKIDIAAAELE